MKGLKTFYLDTEILLELKKIKNPSLLINAYLRNYFSIPQNLEKEDLKQKAVDAQVMADVFNAKVEELTEKEPERKEVFL